MILVSNVQPPSNSGIQSLSRRVIKALFDCKYDGHKIKYKKDDIITLLNYIGSNKNMIEELKGCWGDALLSSFSAKKAVHDIGVRGSKIQHYNKQAIMSGMIVLGENNNILNRKWLNSVAPHTTKRGTDKYVNKCVGIRAEFDMGLKKVLCVEQGTLRRNSMIYFLFYCVTKTDTHPNTIHMFN